MQADNYTIRSATTGDIDKIVEMNKGLFLEDGGTRDTYMNLDWPEQNGRDHFMHLIESPDHLCFLAEVQGRAVGYLAGAVSEKNDMSLVVTADLESMFVEAQHRHLGIGGDLVKAFLQWSESKHAERVRVTAYAANENAIRFYVREGFTPKEITLELVLNHTRHNLDSPDSEV